MTSMMEDKLILFTNTNRSYFVNLAHQFLCVLLVHPILYMLLQIVTSCILLQNLPNIVLKIIPLQLLSHVVNKYFVSVHLHHFDVFLCSHYKIHPRQIKHHHLTLDLVIIGMLIIKNYLFVSSLFQIEVFECYCLLNSYILL